MPVTKEKIKKKINVKLLILIFIFSISSKLNAQIEIDAKIVLMNNDTLKTKIDVYASIFELDNISALSINRVVRTIVNRSIVKLKAEDIRQMSFTDLKGNKRLFVQKNEVLQELMFNGKIKWFRNYGRNSYDGTTIINDLMINEFGEIIEIGQLTMSRRKKIKEITKHKPQLIQIIDDMKINDENYLKVLKKYEE